MEQEQRSLMMTGDAFKKIIITKDAPAAAFGEIAFANFASVG